MRHFRLLFPVLLRKSNYVTTFRNNGIIMRVSPSHNTVSSSHVSPWLFIIQFSCLSSYVITFQNWNKNILVSVFIRQHGSKSFTKLRAINQTTSSLFQRSDVGPITSVAAIIHLVLLCNTIISVHLHSINYNSNGLPDTTLESLFSVVCVARFKATTVNLQHQLAHV